jgi:hypothetical protein
MNNLEGKDGLERDLAKLENLTGPWKVAMAPHIKRFKKKPLPHEFTNLCTESSRADAYVNGHIMAVSYGVLAAVIIAQAGIIIWLIV